LRVLAIADREHVALKLHSPKDVHTLQFRGLLVFADVLRSDAAAAVQKCQAAGIQVIMITGDHLNTAKHIGKNIGIYGPQKLAVLGNQLGDLFHFTQAPEQLSIVARATPFDKTILIDQLKADHKLVAMTGDGVNDAPALVKADIGIAMGKSGTDAAREAADMVLVDDAFSTIVDGIGAARGIFENIRKVISYLFTTSYGELGVIFISLLLQLPLPLVAAQILWLNLITDGLLDISLSTEAHTPSIMNKSHLRYKGNIIDKLLLLRIILLGTIMSVGTIIIFLIELEANGLAYARTAAMIVLAIFQWVHAFNSRSETRSIFALGFFTNRAVVFTVAIEGVLLFLAVYHPLFQQLLQTVPVAPNVWVVAIVSSLTVLFAEEVRKYLFKTFGWKKYFTQL
jgi:Ca2+-transporting ATPase